MTRAVVGGLALVCLALVGWTAGVSGLAYLPFWIAAAAPGLTLGLSVFGRHAAGWVAGAAAGYATTSLVMWAVIGAGLASPFAFAAAWLVECAVLHAASRMIRAPAVALRPWTPQDTLALSAVVLLVPALMGAPYQEPGAPPTPRAGRYYRAYFTADFVWHMALTSELGRFEMPPRNPYMAHRGLNYYWTYFLVPAAVTSEGPAWVQNVEAALKVNAECTALLLLASIFLFAWTAGGSGPATALGVILVVLAASAEGFAAAWDLWSRGRPLAALRDINVDAITAWWYNGLRIDGVHRTMFYTPQHGLSCSLGLLGLLASASLGVRAPTGAIVASGVLLGLATTLNPFLGAVFSVIYGLAVLADGAFTRAPLRAIVSHWPAAIPPALAVTWGVANAMGEGAGQALTVGWAGFARNAPLLTLLLGLGPVLLPALAGFIPDRRLPSQPARVALLGLAIALFLFYFVVLSERSWVGFRAGQNHARDADPAARAVVRASARRPRACAGPGARYRDPHRGGPDNGDRHTERGRHRQPAHGARVSLDADRQPRTARSAALDSHQHAPRRPLSRRNRWCAAVRTGASFPRSPNGGRQPAFLFRFCPSRNTRSGPGRCRPSSRRPTWRRRTRRRDGWVSTICGWTATSSRPTRA